MVIALVCLSMSLVITLFGMLALASRVNCLSRRLGAVERTQAEQELLAGAQRKNV